MTEWKEHKLIDLSIRITKGTTPTTIGLKFSNSGINFIKAEAFNYSGRIDKNSFNFIDEETHNKLKRSQLEKDDILFSMAGVYLGKTAIVTDDILPANTNQALGIIRLNKTKANPKYVLHFLRQPKLIQTINLSSGQSAQPNINLDEIGSLEILLPSLKEQHTISEVLDSIEEKIDLLFRQNETLEQLAETIFKQWFLIEANENWEEINFGAIIKQVKERIKDSTAKLEDIKVLSAVKTGQLVLSEDYFTKQVFSKDIGKYIVVNQFDFAYNPSRINIGSIGMLSEHFTGAVSPVYVVVRPKKSWHYYLQFMLKQQFVKSTIEIYASGSVRQSLDYDSFSKIEIKLPPFEKVEMFNNYYSDSLTKINSNKKQIKTLTHLRDTLLPKLMSGEVRVEN